MKYLHTHKYIYGYTGGCNKSNTGSATSGTGIAHTSAASEFITVHFVQSLVFPWVLFCQSMFVFLSFFLSDILQFTGSDYPLVFYNISYESLTSRKTMFLLSRSKQKYHAARIIPNLIKEQQKQWQHTWPLNFLVWCKNVDNKWRNETSLMFPNLFFLLNEAVL